MLKEFKKFISKGNVVDLAVGVIIGGAFGKIVSSLVNDILMPIIGILIGGIDFSSLSIKVGSAKITYGMFIQNIIDFLIIAFCVFIFVKIVNKISNLATEARQKLNKIRPTSIGMASRISGVNPSDIAILLVYLKRYYNEWENFFRWIRKNWYKTRY